MEQRTQTKDLTQDEIIETFVKVLSDTYVLKRFLLGKLPEMTYRCKKMGLKMLIIRSGDSLNTQLLRLDMAVNFLNRTRLESTLASDDLNCEKYLFKDINRSSLYNDAKLLNHLMVIVGIEINSFRLLELLSRHIYPKSVHVLMRLNLKDATKFEKMLIATYHTYLQIKLYSDYNLEST
jgi:ferritin-like metal-binding protein YciE